MKSVVALGTVLLMVACAAQVPATAHLRPPTALDRDQAELLILRADDLRRQALEFPGIAGVAEAFGGIALQRLRAHSQVLATRGMREEERSSSRELVFWDPLGEEAVLQVVAEQRVVSADEPNPSWSVSVRQWWARLQNVGGSWLVVDEQDLPPDRWR